MYRNALRVLVLCGCGLALAQTPPARNTHELLNSVLWAQTAIEHDAACLQSFTQARVSLDRALKDKNWTAAIEQKGKYQRLPPAIILDIDETVVDNSPAEAEMVKRKGPFITAVFDEWVERAEAAPLPGAVEFTQYAASKKVEVLFLTNRERKAKDATRRNLAKAGFPLRQGVETIFCRGEKPEWTSEKSIRRQYLAERYRILLLLGDDAGDFMPGIRTTIAERRKIAASYADRWGVRWILLPNPMYGTWENAIFGNQNLPDAEQLRLKWEQMRTMSGGR